MGAQASLRPLSLPRSFCARTAAPTMAPMKTMKTAKSMSKSAIAEALATSGELKKSVCAKAINSLAELATQEVAKTGIFMLPGLCRLKTRTKPATKAVKREVFGQVYMVKAKHARKVVKAFPAKAIK